MLRLTLLAASLAALTGCWPRCGSYDVSNTTATDYEGAGYDGTYHEACGPKMGSSASWNLYGDGDAQIFFFPDAPGDAGWRIVDIEMNASFPNALLVPGTTITPANGLFGGVYIDPCGGGCPTDDAGLTDGTIEVHAGDDTDDVCALEDGPTFKLTWDLTFGGGDGPTYTAKGHDRMTFDTFLAPDCDTGGY